MQKQKKKKKEKAVSMRPKVVTERAGEQLVHEAKIGTAKQVAKSLSELEFMTLADYFSHLREVRLSTKKEEDVAKSILLEYLKLRKTISIPTDNGKMVKAVPKSTPKIDAWEIWQELKSRELGAQITEKLFNEIFRVNIGVAKANLGADVVDEWDVGKTNQYAGVDVSDI